MANSNRLTITRIESDFTILSLDRSHWDRAGEVSVESYWSGNSAPESRHFKARLLWSGTALFVRFEAVQAEPLIISEKPDLSKKTMGLWDRDVCEIFIAPDDKASNRYFEFEIAPTGEWLDVAISITADGRCTNWEYASKMESAVRIDKERVVMAIKIPFTALGKTPKAGEIWLGNLFRCVGKDPTRGYLAWSPTKTAKPNFHVPSNFGEFEFLGAK